MGGARASASVRFNLLGSFTVLLDGVPAPGNRIGSRQGRTLLKLLLLKRDRMVSADHIAEVIWGDDPPARWDRDLATLVSRLRGVFGPEAITGGPAGYRFASSERFETDLTEAERLVLEAESRGTGEPALAQAAAE